MKDSDFMRKASNRRLTNFEFDTDHELSSLFKQNTGQDEQEFNEVLQNNLKIKGFRETFLSIERAIL